MDILQKRRKLLGAVSSLCSAAIFASFAASSSPLIAPVSHARQTAPANDGEPSALAACALPDGGAVADAFSSSFESQTYPLFVGGAAYPFETLTVNGEYYVAAESFLSFAGISAGFEAGERYFEVNGRCRPAFSGVVGAMRGDAVPLFELCLAVGLDAEKRDGAVFITGEASAAPGDGFYDGDDLFWLSRIIRAESETEPFEGKIAVGNVVLNRVRSSSFPDDVKGVVFDRRGGVAQFSPASTDAIYAEPGRESVAAAKICLEGFSLSDEIIFFMNPDLATSSWISDNRPAVMTIGNHTFYS